MEEQDSSVSAAIKVTLPENVMRDLSEYCEALSLTKSDVIKSAIKEYIRDDDFWAERLFFFSPIRDHEGHDIHNIHEDLQDARKGWCVTVAVSSQDDPTSAEALRGDLIKVDGEYVHIKLSTLHISYESSEYLQEIKMVSGSLSIPYAITDSSRRRSRRRSLPECIYKIHRSLIWDIDKHVR